MIMGFYDDDFLQKLRKKDCYLTIVDQEHYVSKEHLHAKENYYDIIISRELIEHVHNQHNYIQLCHRLLKKLGILIIETPNIHTWYSKLLFLFSDYLSFFRGKYISNYQHKHPLFTWSLKQLIKGKFLLEKLEFNFGVIPFLGIRFSTKRKLLGDSMNVVLRKI